MLGVVKTMTERKRERERERERERDGEKLLEYNSPMFKASEFLGSDHQIITIIYKMFSEFSNLLPIWQVKFGKSLETLNCERIVLFFRESIFGYKDLSVEMYYSAAKLNTYVNMKYSDKISKDKFIDSSGISLPEVTVTVSSERGRKVNLLFCYKNGPTPYNCIKIC